MKSLILVVCLLLTGCAAAPPTWHYTNRAWYEGKPKTIWVWIDNSFDTYDKINITEAMALWNKSLNGYIELRSVLPYGQPEAPKAPREQDWVITKVPPGDSSLPHVDAGTKILGAVNVIGGNKMFLARDAMDHVGDIYGVTLHEIGHLLGAEHMGDHLMYPHYDRDKFHCIDLVTALQVSKKQNIPAGRINYCMFY